MKCITKADDAHKIEREGRKWRVTYPNGDKYRGFRTQREAIGFVLDDFDTIKIRYNHHGGFHGVC